MTITMMMTMTMCDEDDDDDDRDKKEDEDDDYDDDDNDKKGQGRMTRKDKEGQASQGKKKETIRKRPPIRRNFHNIPRVPEQWQQQQHRGAQHTLPPGLYSDSLEIELRNAVCSQSIASC